MTKEETQPFQVNPIPEVLVKIQALGIRLEDPDAQNSLFPLIPRLENFKVVNLTPSPVVAISTTDIMQSISLYRSSRHVFIGIGHPDFINDPKRILVDLSGEKSVIGYPLTLDLANTVTIARNGDCSNEPHPVDSIRLVMVFYRLAATLSLSQADSDPSINAIVLSRENSFEN